MRKGDPSPQNVVLRPVLSSYDNYEDAQKAVDTLSDNGFPVQHLAIVGVDLRLVESVLGRMSWARAALGGAATVAWLGALVGLFVSFFGSQDVSAFEYVLLGLLYGAGFGIVFGLVSYGFTGRRRDFVSRQDIQASRYDVLCDSEVLGKARKVLGLAAVWPPPLETAGEMPEADTTATQPPSASEQ
jgi:hypothetical protein